MESSITPSSEVLKIMSACGDLRRRGTRVSVSRAALIALVFMVCA